MKYKKGPVLANIGIKYFALETPEGRKTVKKWKSVPFPVHDFNFTEYCRERYGDPFS